MTERWESLAQENAEFYIWTDVANGDDFFASGERDAKRILDASRPYIAAHGRALEIGCGVGRMTIPMSREFSTITAVDIAPTMLKKLAANCHARGVTNVVPMLAGAAWDMGEPLDFVYSRIVFQHIESWAAIRDYLIRVSRCLAPMGVAYLQFDTRAPDITYHVKNALPDVLLPKNFRRGVRRIRRTVEQVRETMLQLGLEIVVERGAGTADTELVLRRKSPKG